MPSLWSAASLGTAHDAGVSCDYTNVDIPPNLAGKGCTLGGMIRAQGVGSTNEPVWACPTLNLAVPPTIGVVGGGLLPVCAHDPVTGKATVPDGGACEAVYTVDGTKNACLSSPKDGWTYIWDHKQVLGGWTCESMGCGGPCPAAQHGPY